MNRVPGWWAAASTLVSRHHLWALAQGAGGWPELERLDGGGLLDLGVDPGLVRRWLSWPDSGTLGVAIPRTDSRYPTALVGDERSPPLLYVEGRVELLECARRVSVVGTRACSARGAAIARRLGRDLAEGGAIVVSGLARGVDTAAHEGALVAGGGRTIAVVGHGLAMTAPRSNEGLRKRIVAAGGLVVSGWEDSFTPERWTFPMRNRWVAGLGEVTVVVEGDVRSGALITANDSIELGRDVWVVPGPPGQPTSAGPLALLDRQHVDLEEERDLLRQRLEHAVSLLSEGSSWSQCEASALRLACQTPHRGAVRLLRDRGAFLQAVLGEHVAGGSPPWLDELLAGCTVEEVASRRGRPVRELQQEITLREVRGELVRLRGGRYASSS